MKTREYLKISKAETALWNVIKLLKSRYNWSPEELLLFTDLRDRCNLFDFDIEQAYSKLPGYKS